jgi:tetratricopeptide (TPR) repeat protein
MTDRSPQGVKQPAARGAASGEAALMQTLRQAWTLHQAGRLVEAEPLYRAVLAEAPSQTDALHFLGLLQSQRGDKEAGLALIDRAIAAAPGNAGAHYNRANILAEAGRYAEAVAGFDRVIAIRPGHTGAWHNRGVFLHQLKR